MSYAERFSRRKEKLKKISEEKRNFLISQDNSCQTQGIVPNFELANKIYEDHKNFYSFESEIHISEDEAKEFLRLFKNQYNKQCFDNMINQCKKEVISTIVNPFGLGHIVAAYDKVGGNVDTIHNVRDGIYATSQEQEKYAKLDSYDSNLYHKDADFIKINAKHSKSKKNGESIDYMTGKKILPNQHSDLDHIVSANEIHNDPGRVLAEIDGRKLANTESNLAPTDSTLNRSKNKKTMEEYLNQKNQRLEKIQELEGKNSLSTQEKNELNKLKKMEQINDEMALNADKNSRQQINQKINQEYYTSKKFVANVAKTGITEGAKMGLQQAVGLVMVEFFTLLFDEVIDVYKNGFKTSYSDQTFLNALKTRINNIATKLKERWKELAKKTLEVGIMGFISGFISNLATVAINMFVTTSKRIVRIIREGILSLFRAVKLLLFPPSGMSFEDAFHEAKKLIATSVVISIGILIEGYVDTLTKSIPIVGTLNLGSILVGAITAFATALIVYYIDKKRNDKQAIKELVNQTDKSFDRIEKMLCEIL